RCGGCSTWQCRDPEARTATRPRPPVTAVSVGAAPTFAGISVDAEARMRRPTSGIPSSRLQELDRSQRGDERRSHGFVQVTHGVLRHRVLRHVRLSVRRASGAGVPGTTTLTEPEPNIDADPLFVDALAGNYQLTDGSPRHVSGGA